MTPPLKSEYFTYDHLFEIFSWLPVKILLKFASISKPCFQFLSNPTFIQQHTFHAFEKDDEGYYLKCQYSPTWQFLPTSDSILHPFALDFIYDHFLHVLASSNGLLLCLPIATLEPDFLYVVNPALQTYQTIPISDELQQIVQYETSPDYGHGLIFECGLNPQQFPGDGYLYALEADGLWAFSSITDLWTLIKPLTRSSVLWTPRQDNYVLLSPGELYFLCDSFHQAPCVQYMSLTTGNSTTLQLPSDAWKPTDISSWDLQLFKWQTHKTRKATLALIKSEQRHRLTIWIKKQTNWFLLRVITIFDLVKEMRPIISGFTLSNGTWIIFTTAKNIYRYNLLAQDFSTVEDLGPHHMFDFIGEYSIFSADKIQILPFTSTLRF